MKLPIYQQLADKLAAQIKAGVFSTEEKLPSVRALAKQMQVSM